VTAAPPAALETPLTALTGIRYPIVQTGMGYVAGARLAAATCRAGGLGIVAAATMTTAEMTAAISAVRARSGGAPFGVNIRADATDAAERVSVLIGEGVPVASFALAPKPDLITRLKDAGVVVMASAGARRHAEKVAAWGVDAVIATGGEAGGHTGPVPTTLLLPDVVDAVRAAGIPVIAAGGFFDGRGLVAALAYGACGIAMGTRFLLTSDSPVPDAVKREYLARGVRDTLVTTRVDGVPHRVLRTPLVDALERSGRAAALLRSARSAARLRRISGLSWRGMIREGLAAKHGRDLTWAQTLMAANTPAMLRAAMVDGRADLGVMASGQVTGLIGDLPSCAGLIESIMNEAHRTLASLAALQPGAGNGPSVP
jgi:NAD(P)H-dependent flavin oxidoreductase YrpB (nitropropane dioxygenase family)